MNGTTILFVRINFWFLWFLWFHDRSHNDFSVGVLNLHVSPFYHVGSLKPLSLLIIILFLVPEWNNNTVCANQLLIPTIFMISWSFSDPPICNLLMSSNQKRPILNMNIYRIRSNQSSLLFRFLEIQISSLCDSKW